MKIEAIVRFIEKREPGFQSKCRGCTPDVIEDLLEFLPGDKSLPKLYKAFLETLGDDAAGFQLLPSGDFLALELWFHHLKKYPSYPQSRYFKFGIDVPVQGVDIAHDWFFDLERMSSAGDDAVVVRYEDEGMPEDFETEQVEDVYTCFEDMVRSRAFFQYVLDRLPVSSMHQVTSKDSSLNRAEVAQEVIKLFEYQGLEPVTKSSANLWTGEAPGKSRAALVFVPPISTGITVYVASSKRKALLTMNEVLGDHFDVYTAG